MKVHYVFVRITKVVKEELLMKDPKSLFFKQKFSSWSINTIFSEQFICILNGNFSSASVFARFTEGQDRLNSLVARHLSSKTGFLLINY